MLQTLEKLEEFYNNGSYENNSDHLKRKDIILSEIPERKYENTLDIGCGNGFITRELPGKRIIGVDLSSNAIEQAKSHPNEKNVDFTQLSIFELNSHLSGVYDLIIITGVLYPQYIGEAKSLVYKIVDRFLVDDGILLCSHIHECYTLRFPYLMLENYYFEFREYTQCLEVYLK